MMRPAPISRGRFGAVLVICCLVGSALSAAGAAGDDLASPNTSIPRIRRIKVPADRPDLWPKGDWQPIPLADLERQLDAAQAVRMRPLPYIEHAEYSARFVDGGLCDGRLTWSIRRPEATARLLRLGDLNLNLAGLAWSGPASPQQGETAICGNTPQGTAALFVDRAEGRLDGQWSLDGRKLAASTEFEIVLAPATTSRLKIKVPAGMVVSSSSGESPRLLQAAEAGWSEWEVWLGSRTRTRLRMAPAADPTASRPLNVARSSVSYIVRSEAVRLFAEFDLEVLESTLREVRLLADPEIQVTSIEYGDAGVVAWSLQPSDQGSVVVVQLPEPISGEAPALQIQAISQIKQFGVWTLPRLRMQNFLEAESKVTLRLQPPLTAADIRSDGYRQLSLTTEAEGESMLFRQVLPGAAITIVPAETKPDLACRAVSLVQPDRSQWTLTSQLDWSASAGGTYAVACRIPPMWEIVDVRPAAEPAGEGELTGWEVEEPGAGERSLHVFFRNALNSGRPQRFRVTARRVPPAPGEQFVIPPLVPLDADDVEHFTIVATGPESRPVAEPGLVLEQIDLRNLSADVRNLDFVAARLSDRHARFFAIRTLGAATTTGLRIEALEPRGPGLADNSPETGRAVSSPPAQDRVASLPIGSVPVSLHVTTAISGTSSGFDEYKAEFHVSAWDESHPFRFTLDAPADLVAASAAGMRLAAVADQGTYTIAAPVPDVAPPSSRSTIKIEYRVPAILRYGANSRKLILPVPEGEVLRFELTLVVPEHLRLAGEPQSLRFDGLEERTTWHSRLLGPFARTEGESPFNPFDPSSWNRLAGPDRRDVRGGQSAQTFRSVASALPDEVRIEIWRRSEVAWLTIAALAICALVSVLARQYRIRLSRAAGACTVAGLCAMALVLPPVSAEIAAGGLTGLVLAALLPQRFWQWTGGRDRQAVPVPAGSTQSFVPLALVILAGGWCSLNTDLHAQEPRPPRTEKVPAVGSTPRLMFDVLIPVDGSGNPIGKDAVAYIPRELVDFLRQSAGLDALPAYLIGASTYDGRLDETNRLSIGVVFDVHVLADDPVVRVALPLGSVNLGGIDACRVDGQPRPLIASADGRNVVLELTGPPPAPDAPSVPQIDAGNAPQTESNLPARSASHRRVPTHRVELQLQPPTETGRENLSMAAITIPANIRTRATLAATAKPAVLGILPNGSSRRSFPTVAPSPDRPVLRPSPTRRLVFYWSATGTAETPPPAEMQADVSCLADLSSGLIQLRYHVAYRVRSGQLDALAWYVPAGHVLQSVEAPQLSSYRFRPLSDGGREMLIEFSRPQAEDFSLTATFVGEIDRHTDPIRLPLVDPLRLEDASQKRIGLRFHQFALRQPSDLQVGVSAADPQQIVKPRSVDQFVKEWNAAGVRPQQAFDLDRAFVLNLAVQQKSISPAVRGSSVGRIHPGRLDWVYSAEIEQPVIPRFVYRLQIDPRLRIRHVSVQEDGADRLLRWSHLRDTLILFLNDRATRTQTVRVESSLPLAANHEMELPRIRFVGAVPGPERMILFRDADVAVRLANPEDFPLPPENPAHNEGDGEQLVVRLDALPEQANPRVVVERELPRVTAEVAVVLARHAGLWQSTACVAFHVESGRVTELGVEVPAEMAFSLEFESTPPSHTSQLPEVDGRVKLLFHPDEPVKQRFLVMLTHQPALAAGVWKSPRIRPENAEITRSLLIIPAGGFEPVDAALRPVATGPPDWFKDVVPQAVAGESVIYHWDGELPEVEFRTTLPGAEAAVETARVDVWLDRDGTVRGWLGLNLSGSWPQQVELDWPETCRPTSLWVAGEFRSPAAGDQNTRRHEILLPRDAKEKLIWLSWIDKSATGPFLSEPFAPRWPWPGKLPVQRCLVNLHAPPQFHFDVPVSQTCPAVTPPDRYLPVQASALVADGDSKMANGVWLSPQTPASGRAPSVGTIVRVVNEESRQWLLAVGLALGAGLVSWKSAPFRNWITSRETTAWLTWAALWWLWLAAGWFALVVVCWVAARVLFYRNRPQPAESGWLAGGPPP